MSAERDSNAGVVRGSRERQWWSAVGDMLAVAVLLLLAAAPFREAVLDTRNVAFGTDMVQHYSREVFHRRALTDTWVPLWNPYEFSGFPAQADPQTGVFYPPSLLLRLFAVPTFLTWTVILHIWVFGVGGYALCRGARVGRLAALAGAAGLMLGGVTMGRAYAGHLDVLRTVAWVPLALAAAIRSIDRGTARPTVAAVLVLSVEVLGSFLQLACYTLAAIALYGVWAALWPASGRASWTHTGRLARQYVLLVLLVLGITAFQLLPTARLITAAGRTGGMPYASAIEAAQPLRDLPRDMFAPATGENAPAESWEHAAYVGGLLAALAPFAWLRRDRRRSVAFLTLLGALAVALASGGPLYSLHYALVPMFRIPGRFMCFWAIAVATLGAVALDGLAVWLGQRGTRRVAWIAYGVPIAAVLLVVVDVSAYAGKFVRVRLVADRFITSVPFTPTPQGRVLSMCEDRFQTNELSALGLASVDGYNSYFLGDYAHLAERARGEPSSSQLKAFPRIGSGTLVNAEVVDALDVTDIVSCDPLDVPGLEVVKQSNRYYWYRNTRAFGRAAPRCADEGRTLTELAGVCPQDAQVEVLAADTPTGRLRLRLSLPAARTIVLAEPYYPERRARVDGMDTPIERANIGLSAIKVAGGLHVVDLKFVPTTLYEGALISLATLAAWAWISRRGHRAGAAA